ncbi:MAG: helix-hairpin-helix domain-containing protein [Verrucomicrobiia bacterium]
MKLNFFKSSKPEPAGRPAKTSASAAAQPTSPLSPDNRPQGESGPQKSAADLPPITLPVVSILSELPSYLFVPGAQAKIAKLTIELPSSWVLPQLATGIVTLRVSDLIPYFPQDMLQQPVPHLSDHQMVTLPLAQIVASIPPEVFELQHESAVDLNSPDLTGLPPLFSDVRPGKKHAGFAISPPVEVMLPATGPVEGAQTPASPASVSGQRVWIGLRSLLAVIPDNLLTQPLAVVSGQLDSDARAALPLEPILPQLKTACIKLPLGTIIAALPSSLFVNPLPQDLSEAIPLPLDEIVPQIPPDIFANAMSALVPNLFGQNKIDIPAPFIETDVIAAEPLHPVAPPPQPMTGEPAPMVCEPVAGVPTVGVVDQQKHLVHLNSCSADDLMRIRGIGPAMARRITEFRNAHGPFRSLDELRQVAGVGRKTFRALTGAGRRKLNYLLGVMEDRELSLPEVVRLLGTFPGVDGCIVALEDGLFVTGQLPPPLDRNTISAFGPQLFQRISRYVRELNIGRMHRLTLFTDQRPVSVFRAGDVYLIVVHHEKRYSKALLRRCERVSEEIASLCRQRATL